MNRRDPRFEWMDLADFEEMLPDRPNDEKWELIGGRVVRVMAGARWEHHQVVSNLHVALQNHIRARSLPCRIFQESFWLKSKAQDLAVFPDLMVHRGPLRPGATHVSDPTILIEVISKGSAFRDEVEKRALYELLPGLRQIVLVSMSRLVVDAMILGDDGRWRTEVIAGLDGLLPFPSIDFVLSLAEVYRDVEGSIG